MKAQELWQKVLDDLENHIKRGTYNSISLNVEPLFFRENKLVLLVENEFAEAILSERVPLIKQILFSILQTEAQIEIVSTLEEINNTSLNGQNNNSTKNSLNAQYTFQSFVVGASNQFAHAVCEAVAENPGTKYNPLFLYGDAGLGKTHLMHAIGNKIHLKSPNEKILYITTEAFMNDMIKAIKTGKNDEFRDLYRKVDVLLIDDIQFIEARQSTQEEFFHTFNALHNDNKQIIISSDRAPKDIPTLEDRLRSRFEQGLTADIQAPDYETRVAILLKKSQIFNKNIPNEVIDYVARNIKSNIRELEGAITKIAAHADLYKTDEITLEIAKDVLKTLLDNTKREITPLDIKEKVSQYFGINIEDLNKKKRTKQIAYARQVVMYLCKTLIDNSTYENIGGQFGGKDHTTVIHAVTKIKELFRCAFARF